MKTLKKTHSTNIQKHFILNSSQLSRIKGGEEDRIPLISEPEEDDEIE
ncbi:MAG: hypothetical protein MI739_05160 [Bacteroidales bacterium]|nr:hypothetical protein [Bacteroidales bacterium]